MKYGLIGEHLTHSYSCEIHAKIADYQYELCELRPEEVGRFMEARDFCAINVTIPYKQVVMPYLDEISDMARAVGAVNTVVNRGGRLYGYNTDVMGMEGQLWHMGLELSGKKVLILGAGGTSATAVAVARHLGAGEVWVLARHPKEGGPAPQISYEEGYAVHADAQIIINTTPKGMYHNEQGTPLDVSRFPRLEGLLDAIYHPIRTQLVQEAAARGVRAEGGLYMLVAQAVYACGHFLDRPVATDVIDDVFTAMCREKRNLVLIGMPSSGKTTVGGALAAALGMPLVDTDALVTERLGMPIAQYIPTAGETAFRDIESAVVAEAGEELAATIISTGGGAILRPENILALRKNGVLIFLDRALEDLITTSDRPLSSDREKLAALYAARHDKYLAAADLRVDGGGSVAEVAERILSQLKEIITV